MKKLNWDSMVRIVPLTSPDALTLHFVINENRPQSIVMDFLVAIVLLFHRLESCCVSYIHSFGKSNLIKLSESANYKTTDIAEIE